MDTNETNTQSELRLDSLIGIEIPEPTESDEDSTQPNTYNPEDGVNDDADWITYA